MTDASTRPRRTPSNRNALRLAPALLAVCALAALAAAGQALATRDLTLALAAPPTVVDNTTFDVNMSSYNTGTGAGSSVEIQLYLDGNATAGPHNVGNLANGEYGNASENFTLPCGLYQFNATVDPSDGVPETNESNNNATLAVMVVPYVAFTSNLSGTLGAYSLALNASASHGCAPLNFTWMIGTDTRYGPVVDYVPLAGNLTVSLTVRSSANQSFSNSIAQNFSVPNAPPTVSLDPTNLTIPTGQRTLLAVIAADADGFIASANVDFGDGDHTTVISDVGEYKYSRSGNFTLSVTVTDNLGANATVSLVVHVVNRPPVVDAGSPDWYANTGQVVPFDASASSDPENGTLTFAWDFGDGTTGTGAQVNHTYADPGVYTAKLTVTDADGASQTAAIAVHIVGTPTSGGFPWIWILILVLLAALVLFMLMRGRRDEEGTSPKPAPSAPPAEPKWPDAKAGEGSSGKPPSK